VAIVGAGPVGLAALLTAQLYSPAWVLMIDVDGNRLQVAEELGASHTADPSQAVEMVKQLTDGVGCDTVIECVGVPETFEQCQEIVAPGGVIANVGVHGVQAPFHIEKLWSANISLTTRLVDTETTPMLLKLLAAKKLPAAKLITHNFRFDDILTAYKTFSEASKSKALKVLIEMD